jgi:hypothetical protein
MRAEKDGSASKLGPPPRQSPVQQRGAWYRVEYRIEWNQGGRFQVGGLDYDRAWNRTSPTQSTPHPPPKPLVAVQLTGVESRNQGGRFQVGGLDYDRAWNRTSA